jgi:hypothetical protein
MNDAPGPTWSAASTAGGRPARDCAPGYDPFGPAGANFNLIIANDAIDPVSGSVPHRAYLCEIQRVE